MRELVARGTMADVIRTLLIVGVVAFHLFIVPYTWRHRHDDIGDGPTGW